MAGCRTGQHQNAVYRSGTSDAGQLSSSSSTTVRIRRCLPSMRPTVFPNGDTISDQNTVHFGQLKQLLIPPLPVIALTATADEATRGDIVRLLELNDPLIQVSSFRSSQYPLHAGGEVQTARSADGASCRTSVAKAALFTATAAPKWKTPPRACKAVV
jgi:hypothetical protein